MNKIIHMIYLVGSNTPSYKIMHYITMKSWLVNTTAKLNFYCNRIPDYSPWWHRLLQEYDDRIEVIGQEEIDQLLENYGMHDIFSKMDSMYHKSDLLRLVSTYESGGLYVDMDHIAIDNWDDIFDNDQPCYPVELNADHHFEAIPNGFFFTPDKSDWIKELIEFYKDYNPESWSETSIGKPTELYFKDPTRIRVLPAGLVDPVSWRYEDWHSFFMHNVDILEDAWAVHWSESITKDFVKYIDLTHIMTVDTGFTCIARKYVEKYWDSNINRPRISIYE